MEIYQFGCAPQAVADGFDPKIEIFNGTLKEAEDKYAEEDVAVVFGASHFGKDGVFEFGVLHR